MPLTFQHKTFQVFLFMIKTSGKKRKRWLILRVIILVWGILARLSLCCPLHYRLLVCRSCLQVLIREIFRINITEASSQVSDNGRWNSWGRDRAPQTIFILASWCLEALVHLFQPQASSEIIFEITALPLAVLLLLEGVFGCLDGSIRDMFESSSKSSKMTEEVGSKEEQIEKSTSRHEDGR